MMLQRKGRAQVAILWMARGSRALLLFPSGNVRATMTSLG